VTIGAALGAYVVVVGPLALSVLQLVTISNPQLGWAEAVYADALALSRGDLLPTDPDRGVTSMLYGPVFPALLAGLGLLHDWSGWGLFVNLAAVLSLPVVAALILVWPRSTGGYPPALRAYLEAGAFATALAAMAIGCVLRVPLNLVYDSRADNLAWLTSLVGVALLIRGASRPYWCIGAGLIVVGAFLKPTVATLLVGIALGMLVVYGAASVLSARMTQSAVRERIKTLGVVGGISLTLVVAIDFLLFDGWILKNTLVTSLAHSRLFGFSWVWAQLRTGLGYGALPLVAVVASLVLASFVPLGSRWRHHLAFSGRAVPWMAVLVIATAVVGLGAVFAWRKQGADSNQFLGVIWCLSLIPAVVFAGLPSRLRGFAVWVAVIPVATGILVTMATGPASVTTSQAVQALPTRASVTTFVEAPRRTSGALEQDPFLAQRVESGTLLPLQVNLVDQLAAGYSPDWIIDTIAKGESSYRSDFAWFPHAEDYASAYGRKAYGSLWAINSVRNEGFPREMIDARCGGAMQLGDLRLVPAAVPSLWCLRGDSASLIRSEGAVSWLRVEPTGGRRDIYVRGVTRVFLANPVISPAGTVYFNEELRWALQNDCALPLPVSSPPRFLSIDSGQFRDCGGDGPYSYLGFVGEEATVSTNARQD